MYSHIFKRMLYLCLEHTERENYYETYLSHYETCLSQQWTLPAEVIFPPLPAAAVFCKMVLNVLPSSLASNPPSISRLSSIKGSPLSFQNPLTLIHGLSFFLPEYHPLRQLDPAITVAYTSLWDPYSLSSDRELQANGVCRQEPEAGS